MIPVPLQGIPGTAILTVILMIVGVLAVLGLVGLYLFNHFIRGYNEAAGYSDD
jgi:hypothetical protein